VHSSERALGAFGVCRRRLFMGALFLSRRCDLPTTGLLRGFDQPL
jgi:hypothetical protein